MSKSLFSEFPKVSTNEWKQKIQYDLNGKDYAEAVVWHSPEGIDVKPFYNIDDQQRNPISAISEWLISQTIFVADVGKSNRRAINIIERGADSICFVLPDDQISLKRLLSGIDLEAVTIQFKCEFLSSDFNIKLKRYISDNYGASAFDSNIIIHSDIIGNLARTGNWHQNLTEDHTHFTHIVDATQSLSVDLSLYQNAGANMVQQLAYALAHLNEYLNHLEHNSKDLSKLNVNFEVAVGSNYFFEIAKIKALRMLYASLAAQYQFPNSCRIFASPTRRNKTLYDYNTNMLRTTTECMSAILGGADFIGNIPYDNLYKKHHEFSDRIARNQLLILRNESFFDKNKNASDGTFYIASLTHQLAQKALTTFKDIEQNGGFLKQLKEGTIQRKIKQSAASEQNEFDEKNIKSVGTNFHINPTDKMKSELELFPFVKYKSRKTLLEPIVECRLAEKIEQTRLENEAQ